MKNALRLVLNYTTTADRFLILALLFISIYCILLIMRPKEAINSVVIENNNLTQLLALDKDTIITITGAVGDMQLAVKSGEISVISSSCPDKICQHMGPIPKRSDIIVCIPNRVLIKANNSANVEIDSYTPAVNP